MTMPNINIMKQQITKKTFIVDDDPFWTAILSEILQSLGYTNISTFKNGEECIKHLHLNPHLVFLDHQMEDMDGIEVLRQIKEYYPGIGVVFCTAHENLSVAVEAIRYGSFEYLLKANSNRREVETIISQMKEAQVFADRIY